MVGSGMTTTAVYADSQSLATSVSRVLGKRFTRTSTEGSRISGYPNVYPGFKVTASDRHASDGHVAVRISYEPGRRDRDPRVTVSRHVDTMAAYLRDNLRPGWSVPTLYIDNYGYAFAVIEAPQGWR